MLGGAAATSAQHQHATQHRPPAQPANRAVAPDRGREYHLSMKPRPFLVFCVALLLAQAVMPAQVRYTFQPGDAMYEDINHDGNINYQDVVYLGNSNPKFTGGFGTSVSFKGLWKLTAFFNYRFKYDVINGTKMNTTNMYGFDNQSTAVLRRWRKEGDVTDIPRALYRNGYNFLGSDRYVEDASFLRFRTITLRYTAPKKISDKLKMKNLSGYLTVENLYTWTKYTGQDPEVTVSGTDPFRVALDESFTPPAITFTLGLTVSF